MVHRQAKREARASSLVVCLPDCIANIRYRPGRARPSHWTQSICSPSSHEENAMDPRRFDNLSRDLIMTRSRRDAMGVLLGSAFGLLGLTETTAKHRNHKKKHHSPPSPSP